MAPAVLIAHLVGALTAQAGRLFRCGVPVVGVAHLVGHGVGIRLQPHEHSAVVFGIRFLIHGIEMTAGTVVAKGLAADAGIAQATDGAVHAPLADQVEQDFLFLTAHGTVVLDLSALNGVGGAGTAVVLGGVRPVYGQDGLPHIFMCVGITGSVLLWEGQHNAGAVAQRHGHGFIPGLLADHVCLEPVLLYRGNFLEV